MKYGKKFDSIGSLSWDRDNFFRAILAVLFLDALFSTLQSRIWVQQGLFLVCVFVKKLHHQSTIFMLQLVASANMLWTSTTPLAMIVSMAENKVFVIRNISNINGHGIIDY